MHLRPYYPLLDTSAVEVICAPASPPPPPAASPADAAPLPSSSSDAIGTGAIAGIVAGSVAGGALLVLLVLAVIYMCRGGRRPFDASASPAIKAPV